jgi:hypothetical protein
MRSTGRNGAGRAVAAGGGGGRERVNEGGAAGMQCS